MRIAIIGAGMAGIGTAWHLLQKKGVSVDLFDPNGISQGASGISSGLLHPFPGKHALKSWRADEGMKATRELIEVAERASRKKVASRTGIFRPAMTLEQKNDFSQRGEWLEVNPPLSFSISGLWIPEGMTVFTARYLEGLWLACKERGGQLFSERIEELEQLDSYDGTLVTTGYETLRFSECAHLPLKKTPGQILTCRWKEPLPFSMVSHCHIALTEWPDLCRIGSTYEHGEILSKNAISELKQKASLFYPPALDYEVVEVKSGVRITAKEGYQPIVERIGEKRWVFTGLGSRGMLYHALLGKEVAEAFG